MGIFNRHPNEVPAETTRTTSTSPPHRSGTLFGGRRSSVTHNGDTVETTNPTRRSGFLHRNEDASIVAARQRVMSAEAAEKDADRALVQARHAVKDARDHVKRIEREAAEGARLAKLKQAQAHSISKRAKPLGRHGHLG
ncbi:uncharacterized protein BP5553_07389 [Venustampulla echinocandica]|uniref:Uncharacterized protein n=1 Tax=Venustampulla echinocandica TaxID=2656787 RepID=A0A370TJD4_9HELO|nr:uncharacterized protein BP5553_07389 [Venustampulla echinocandica]RDL35458.1 hypothetical protein BP5553_07389 [Venustampulla echinocandica]